jgi:hypothetical protein
MDKLSTAFKLFDDYNKKDPRVFEWGGVSYPQEYFFAVKLYDWVLKLEPEADEELLLASRCQHIGRWEMPRESYPDGRDAYLKWRKDLAQHHVNIADKLMSEAGYPDEFIERVNQILLKKRIKVDPDVQAMENALCLVFLEFQYEDFRKKYAEEPDKMVTILYKSLLKMDAKGHAFALKLPFSTGGIALIQQALNKM